MTNQDQEQSDDPDKISVWRDKANMFTLIIDQPSYISFYTGEDGTGSPLRETMCIKRNHYDPILERMANRKAKKLGACSWMVFKPIGVAHNISYGVDEDDRIDYLMEQHDGADRSDHD